MREIERTLRELRSWKRESQRSWWRMERRQVMKVRALTQRGTLQRVRRKKTYRDREGNSQKNSKWIHVDQVLHHQVCDVEKVFLFRPFAEQCHYNS